MEFAAILRLLGRHRILMALGLVLAVVVAVLAVRGATTVTGLASMRVVVETPRSQLVDAAPPGSAAIQVRSQLLGDLVATTPVLMQIAKLAGISTSELTVVDPTLNRPVIATPLPTAAAQAAAGQVQPYVVTVNVPDDTLPIVELDGTAPDTQKATRLVRAAAAALTTVAAPAGSTPATTLTVRAVAAPRVKNIVKAPRHMLGVAAALLTFILWCAGIVLVQGGRRRRRRRRRGGRRAATQAA
jgi:hypothetical protein